MTTCSNVLSTNYVSNECDDIEYFYRNMSNTSLFLVAGPV